MRRVGPAMGSAEKVHGVNSSRNSLVDWVLGSEEVRLEIVSTRLKIIPFFYLFTQLAFLATKPPMLWATNTIGVWSLVSVDRKTMAKASYIAVFAEVGRVMEVSEQRLSKIVNGQMAALSCHPVGVVPKTVKANMSEPNLVWQPFFGPEHARIGGMAPSLSRTST